MIFPLMYPLVQAVAAPEPDVEVFFDFNDAGTWRKGATSKALANGWTIGVAERLSGPGDPRTAWGNRKPAFAIELSGDRQSALAAQSQAARWLQRPEGWLRVKLDEWTPPVYLRTLGASAGDLSFERIYIDQPGPDHWGLTVALDAEPWLYGERQALGQFVLSSDPASGMWVTLPDALGDAPARLRVTFDAIPGGVEPDDVDSPALALGVSPAAPVVWQVGSGDGFTGYSATTDEADAAASGGSRKRIDFGTDPTMQTRFAGTAPAVPCGLYRVWALGENTSADKAVPTTLALNSTIGDTVSWPAASGRRWTDYGLYAIPTGLVDLPGVAGGSVSPSLTFSAGGDGLTVSDDLLVDAFVLVPVRMVNEPDEASLLDVDVTGFLATLMLDGDREVPYAMKADGSLAAAQGSIDIVGGWPEVRPGVANVLSAWRTDAADIAGSVTVTVSYHPRSLYLQPTGGT